MVVNKPKNKVSASRKLKHSLFLCQKKAQPNLHSFNIWNKQLFSYLWHTGELLCSLSARVYMHVLHTERSAYLEGWSGGPGVPAYVLPGSGILGLQVRSLISLKTRKLALEMQALGGREHLTSYAWGWRPNSLFMHSNSILERVYTFNERLICKVVSSLGFVFKCFLTHLDLPWISDHFHLPTFFQLSSQEAIRW